MIRLAVSGATGKMGQAIIRLAAVERDLEVTGILGPREQEYTARQVMEISPLLKFECTKAMKLVELAGKVDLLIDFSGPAASVGYLEEAMELGLPIVLGTTGFSEAENKRLREASKKLAILQSANMSIGMNLIVQQAALLAKSLGESFDIDIIETHHNQKQDSPSGTAKMIGAKIIEAKGLTPKAAVGPEAGVRARDGYPRYHHLRSGGVVGEHSVRLTSQYEQVEIRHLAMNRDLFAAGALRAARFLYKKPAGNYSMTDLLGAM